MIRGARWIHSWLGFRLVSGYLGNLLAMLPDYGDAQILIAHGDSLLLPLRGIPLLRVMHGSALEEARTARTLSRKILQFGVYLQERLTVRTQATIAISRNTRDRYPRVRGVIPNGVNTNFFFPDASVKSLKPVILFVGTLGGRKRGDLLLELFDRQIRPEIPEARLWMVSRNGPKLDGVMYFPGLSDETLSALYRRATVFASPSLYEGFGLPYLEAMASGTPVVAVANPGSREVTDDGRYGRLIQNDADFVPAVMELLGDAAARAHWIEQGLERSRQLSVERTVDQYENALVALLPRVCVAEAGA